MHFSKEQSLDLQKKADQLWSKCTDVGKEMLSFPPYNLPKFWSPHSGMCPYNGIFFWYCYTEKF